MRTCDIGAPMLPSALLTASASRVEFSQLNTPPARSPVHASMPPSRRPRMTRGQDGSLPLQCMTLSFVGVGIMIAHNPLHGSGRAGFPHPALTSGDDAHAAQRKRMTDMRRRKPSVDQAPHPAPGNPAVLAAARKRLMPEQAYLKTEHVQRGAVHGHPVIADVSTQPPTAATCLFPEWASCMRRRNSAFTSFSLACILLRIVCRSTVK